MCTLSLLLHFWGSRDVIAENYSFAMEFSNCKGTQNISQTHFYCANLTNFIREYLLSHTKKESDEERSATLRP